MKKTIFILMLGGLLGSSISGGLILMFAGTDVAKVSIVPLIKDYCQQPLAKRLAIRTLTNSSLAPHKITITCKGDML